MTATLPRPPTAESSIKHASGRPRRVALPFAVIGLAGCLAAPAFAACTAPVPPDVASKPEKPVPPVKSACIDAKPGTAGCYGWEVHRFNEDVKAFNVKAAAYGKVANEYVTKLNSYVSSAGAYAKCEADSLR